MIHDQNTDHIVVQIGFRNINDLLAALVQADVLPDSVPADAEWGEHVQPLPRFDMDLVIRYRVKLLPPVLDAYVDDTAPGGNEVRLALGVEQGAIQVLARERSTGDVLSRFEYALSGRAFIFGSLETDDVANTTFFTISRPPEFDLDDWSTRIPPLVEKVGSETMLARSLNRAVRLRTEDPSEVGAIRLPISFSIDEPEDITATYGFALRDVEMRDDKVARQICLPDGFGQRSCDASLPLPQRGFFRHLDTFARIETNVEPVPINRAGREIQADIGWRVIDRELRRHDKDSGWKEVAAKLFRHRNHYTIRWKKKGKRGVVRIDGGAKLQVAYPKIKWCRGWTKLPFGGRISYKYPCGIERGWLGVKEVTGEIEIALIQDGANLCAQIVHKHFDGRTNFLGQLLTLLYGTGLALITSSILGMFQLAGIGNIAGALIFAATVLTITILTFLEHILRFITSLLPNKKCFDITEFLTVPVVEDNVDAKLARPLVDMNANGLTIGADAKFIVLDTKDALGSGPVLEEVDPNRWTAWRRFLGGIP